MLLRREKASKEQAWFHEMHTNLNLKHKCLFLRILWHITKSKSAASVAKHFFVVEHFQEKCWQKLIKSEERIPFMLSKAPRLCGLSRLESRHTVLVSQKSVSCPISSILDSKLAILQLKSFHSWIWERIPGTD